MWDGKRNGIEKHARWEKGKRKEEQKRKQEGEIQEYVVDRRKEEREEIEEWERNKEGMKEKKGGGECANCSIGILMPGSGEEGEYVGAYLSGYESMQHGHSNNRTHNTVQ
jgi:hypothetical protein